MKLSFEDGGYIEITKTNDKVTIVVQARDATNTLKTITNACEVTLQQFKELCQGIYEPQPTN